MDQNLVNKLIPQNWPKILGEGEFFFFFNQITSSRLWKYFKKQYIKSAAIMPVPHFYA